MFVLALLLALQDARIAEAVRALDADDPDARAAAVRTLIELDADVSDVLKSADGERKLRAGEVVTAVTLFREAPGLRALWKSDPSRVPPTLIAKLAVEPRDQWPDLIPVDGLDRATREALAGDILRDPNLCRKFLRDLDRSMRRLESDPPRPPVHTWWFCIAALQTDGLEGSEHAASLLGHAVGTLPIEAVDEISAALLARLSDKEAGLYSAYALAATASRLKDDRKRLRALVDALAAHLARDDAENALWALWTVRDTAVQAVVIDSMLAALADPSARVRSNAVSALYKQSLTPGPLVDRMARGLLPLVADPDPHVRLPAIYTLRDRAPFVQSDALLAAALRAFIARRGDPDRACREYAAGAIAHVAAKADAARLWPLVAEARQAAAGTDAAQAAHELYRLTESRDAAIRKAQTAHASDDIDERTRAARALIELDADVDDKDIAAMVRFFRTAPGCRQAWRIRSDAMPLSLTANLAEAARGKWPELVGRAIAAEALTRAVRNAIAADILCDPAALCDAAMPWWFALATLDTPGADRRHDAAASLAVLDDALPDNAVRDVADALVRHSVDGDPRVSKACIQALAVDPRVQRHAAAAFATRLRDRNAGLRHDVLRQIRDFHPRGEALNRLAEELAAMTDDANIELRRDLLLTLEGKVGYASGESFDGVVRSLLPRLDDADSDCRRHAARTLASQAHKLGGDLHRDVAAAVGAAFKREKHEGVRTWLEDATAGLKK